MLSNDIINNQFVETRKWISVTYGEYNKQTNLQKYIYVFFQAHFYVFFLFVTSVCLCLSQDMQIQEHKIVCTTTLTTELAFL